MLRFQVDPVCGRFQRILQKGLRVLQEVLEWWNRPLTTVKQVRQFLGLASYYRIFVPGFASIVTPLTHMTRKDARVVWSPEAQEVVQQVIAALKNAPALSVWCSSRKA